MIAEGEACLCEQKGTCAGHLDGSVEESSTSLSAVRQYTPIAHFMSPRQFCVVSVCKSNDWLPM